MIFSLQWLIHSHWLGIGVLSLSLQGEKTDTKADNRSCTEQIEKYIISFKSKVGINKDPILAHTSTKYNTFQTFNWGSTQIHHVYKKLDGLFSTISVEITVI